MPAMRHRWTTAEVRALTDESRTWPRYELLEGELIVTPAPGTPHQIAATEIWRVLSTYVDTHDLGLALVSPSDLELHLGSIVQPDVFVVPLGRQGVANRLADWSMITALHLAVEIISPSSVRTDRVEKRDHYLSADVTEYWVVDLDARIVERWRRERATPELLRSTLEWWPTGATTPLTINLERLFETVWRKVRRLPTRAPSAQP